MMTIFSYIQKSKLIKTIIFFFFNLLFFNFGFAQVVYNFTNAGATGRYGPTQAQVNTAYGAGNTLNGLVTVNTQGIQEWVVPVTGTYRILTKGAQSALNSSNIVGGSGAILQADVYLNSGDILKIVVGQQGLKSPSANSSSGGGGTFVVKSDNTPIIIAGGGGGVGASGGSAGVNGATTTSGTNDGGGFGSGGTLGSGGTTGSLTVNGGGGGGGLTGSGGAKKSNTGYPGIAFTSGATGGSSRDAGSFGGFGGGGGNHESSGGGGGGGGYSGGAGGEYATIYRGGGGGGSFIISNATNISTSNGLYNSTSTFNGSNISNLNSYNTGDGSVTITQLFSGGTVTLNGGGATTEVCTSYTPGTFASTSIAVGGSGVYSYQWQISTNNSTWNDISGATNTTYAPGADIPTTTYYRRKVTDNSTPVNNVGYSNVLTIIIDPIPTTSIAGTNIILCSGTSTTLAANTALIGTGTWSRTSGPNSPSFSNVNSNTSTISGLTTGTYVLEWKISTSASGTPPSCAVSTSNINLVVGAPSITSTTPGSTCNPGTATLTAVASAGTINWYSASSGGSLLGTGTNFTTATLTSTTTFFVDATGGGCTSASRTAVVATVLPNNTITLSSTAGTDAQSKCINTALTNITYSTTGATGASVTGLPTGVTSAWASNVLTISGTPSVAGTYTYTINLTGGCGSITKTGNITVNQASVGTVSGTVASICVGGTSTFTATSLFLSGGVGAWSSSNTAVATVNASTGLITGIGAGTATITYTITGGCGGTVTAQKLITVNALPSMTAISGATTICSIGSSATLSNTTAGGTWSSANTSVATVDANGVVTGVSFGTSTITYSVTDLNACSNSTSTSIVISALPTTPSSLVANPSTMCTAGTAILTATSTGNLINWYNTATGGSILSTVASGVNYTTGTISTTTTFYAEAVYSSSQTFNYTGALQTYTVPSGITSITIDAYGAKGGNNTAASYVGGKGARAKTTIAVTPGQVLTMLVGGKGGNYNCGAGGGGGTFVVNSSNTPLVIAGGGGGAFYCGALGGANGGGGTATTSGGNGISTPNRSARTGGVNGNGGSSYYGGGGGGFLSAGISSATASHAGNAYPGAATTGGGSGGYGGGGAGYDACCGGAGGGGGYSGGSGGTGDGSAGGGGGSFIAGSGTNNLQTADVNNGDGYIVITSISSSPCLSPRVPVVVTMSSPANAGTISGTASICVGGASTYTATNVILADGTGAWSSSNTAVATVNASTGVITGVSAGTATITYTITGGCGGTVAAQKSITVNALPIVANITGTTILCDIGSTGTLTNTTLGGVWSSSNSSIATINASGVVNGISIGVATISYTVTDLNSCTNAVSMPISISALPATPTNLTVTPSTLCNPGSAVLTAISTGNLINWYTASTGGSILSTVASGAPYTTTSISTNTVYYAEAASNSKQIFNYTGAPQTLTIPAGVTSITIEAWGAQGGSSQTGVGGKGGYSKGDLAVTPGETINIYVGGRGNAGTSVALINGGYNGGGYTYAYTAGAYAGSGGGASDVRKGGTNLANRVIVAGGGGGTGFYSSIAYTGGHGGGTTGGSGTQYSGYTVATGGSQIAGGAAGATSSYSQPGSLGIGGNSTATGGNWNGSGGGGGYYGGGSGAAVGSGGGGGSSFIGGVTNGQTIAGNASMPNPAGGANITGNTGNGVVVVTLASNPCLSPRVPISVNMATPASVASVTGVTSICVGSITTYSATGIYLAGGTGAWSSSNPTVATVNASTGLITALTAGTTNIKYTISGGCGGTIFAQKTITINPLPTVANISGNTIVCDIAGTVSLTNVTSGGIWSSTNSNIASINSSGLVTGVSYGNATITYTVTDNNNCVMSSNVVITVSALPATPINLTATPASVCIGSTSTLRANSSGNNINWYNVSTGGSILSTVLSGATYTTTAITSSKTYYAEAVYINKQTFNYTGAVQSYTAPVTGTYTLEAWGAEGGLGYSLSDGGNGAYATGKVNLSQGETIYIYVGQAGQMIAGGWNGGGSGNINRSDNSGGGGATDFRLVNGSWNASAGLLSRILVAAGGAGGNHSGLSNIAGGAASSAGNYPASQTAAGNGGGFGYGASVNAYTSYPNGGAGGGWYGGGGITAGTSLYASSSGGSSYVLTSSSIKPVGYSPSSNYYLANTNMIAGDASMPNPTGGANIIGKTGNGVATISFSNYCVSPRVPIVVNLSPSASIGSIAGNSTICIGANATYTATSVVLAGGAGSWSSSNTAVATINPSTGLLTALGAGVSTITYTVTGGCGSATAQKVITVASLPVVSPISGSTILCDLGSSTTLTSSTLGGVWSSTNLSIATIDENGLVNGISFGNTLITYTVTDINSCVNSVTSNIQISPLPTTPSNLTATPSMVCSGGTTILNATSNGNIIKWYDVASGGTALTTLASGLNYTTTAITSNKTFYAQASYDTKQIFNFNGAAQSLVIPAGVTSISIQAWGASGGRNTTNVASVSGKGGYASGTLSVTPGETIYIYVGGKGENSTTAADACTTCFRAGGYNGGGIGVNGGAGGGGASDIRKGGSALSNRVLVAGGAGGVGYNAGDYSGGYGGGATGGPGAGSGAAVAGTQIAGYSLGNGGPYTQNNDCGGGGGGYYGGFGGATTNSSGAGGSGYIGGVTSGTTIAGNLSMPNPSVGANITGRDGDGVVIITLPSNPCLSPRVPIVVNLAPSASVGSITGSASICVGSTGVYTATSVVLAGGTGSWSSSNPAVAQVNVSTGDITAISAGTTTLTYSISGGCGSATVQKVVTVYALPVLTAISGPASICVNSSATFTNTTSGGVWSSTNTAIATINSTGVVTGVSSGTAVMRYTYTNVNACSSTISKTINIVGLPSNPTSVTATPNTLLAGATVSLSAISAGNQINWYDVSTGGVPLTTVSSGATYTKTINYTTNFYAESKSQGSTVCLSQNRVLVIVTVANMSTITTTAVSNVFLTTATSGGDIGSDGGTPIIARGVCWSISPNPTISNFKTSDGTGLGGFTSSLTGLSNGTTYYLRAYATNAIGTTYGAQMTFTTLTVPVITSFTPTSGGRNVPISITGLNFNDVNAVKFRGTDALSFIINSNTSITAYPASGASGSITISSPGGTASVSGFTYIETPTVQASNITVSSVTNTQANITWTNGNGSKRSVFVLSGNTGSVLPSAGTTYIANTVFRSGTQVGTTGWYCVYNGTGSSVNITGLSPMTNYRIMVIEYNGNTNSESYFTNTFSSNPINLTTLGPTITTNVQNLNPFTNCIGTPSASQTVTVNGLYLTSNLVITAPNGFEISTSNSGNYSSTITLSHTGGVVTNTSIYIRTTSAASGNLSSTIEFNSNNAITKSVAVGAAISELSVAGTISGNNSVCIGTNTTNLTLSGSAGLIKWQSSSNNNIFSDILSATSTTLTASNLSATTTYRVGVINGVCAVAYSNVFTITANSNPVSAVLSTSAPIGSICVGSNISASISSNGTGGAGNVSDVLQFQYDGGIWNTYTANTNLITVGHNSVAIRTYRTADGSGCANSSASTYSWTINELPSISVHPSTLVQQLCQNSTSTALTITASGAGLSYQWYKNSNNSNTGGTLIVGANSNTYTPSTTNAGTSYYYAVVTGTCSPSTVSNVSGAIIVSAIPVITVHPSASSQSNCLNATATDLSVTATGAALTYQWYENNSNSNTGGNLISGATSAIYKPNTNLVGTKYYYVNVSGTCSPSVTSSNSGAIITNSLPQVQITQGTTLTIGANGIIQLTANSLSGSPTYTYQWYKNAVEISSSPNAGNNYNLHYNVTSVGSYSVKVTDANTCVNISQPTNILALPTMSTLGDNEICAGGTVDFTFDATSISVPANLEWQYSSDNVNWNIIQVNRIENGGLAAVQKYAATATGYYRIAYTDAGITSYTAANTVTIFENPIANITSDISLINLCTNTPLNLTGQAGVGAFTYEWSKSGVILGTSNQLSITSNGIYKVKITDVHGCFGEATSAPVFFNPLPTATISGSTTICEAANSPQLQLIGLNGTAPYTFVYDINSSADITTNTGVTNLQASTIDPGTFVYNLKRVTDAIGCYQNVLSSATIVVNPLPTINIGIADPVSIANTNAKLPYANTANSPNLYSVVSGARAMPNFNQIQSSNLNANPINIIIPPSNAGDYDFNLRVLNSSTGCTSNIVPFVITVNSPIINVSGNLSPMNTTYGSPSSSSRFIFSSSFTVSDVTLSAPAGFELSSNSNSGYTNSLVISPLNESIGSQFVYVRLKANAQVANGPYAGNIVLTANGTGNVFVPIPTSNINAATISITGISVADKYYDGNRNAIITGNPIYQGLKNGEIHQVIGTPVALFTNALAEVGKSITISNYLPPSSNYILIQPSGLNASILKANLMVRANNISVQEGTTVSNLLSQATSDITGYVNAENVSVVSGSISYTTTYTENASVGTSGLKLTPVISNLNASNYNFIPVDGDVNVIINPTSYITVTGNSQFTYNALPQGPATSNVIGSTGSITYVYSGRLGTNYGPSNIAPTNAGYYQVIANLAADQVYQSAVSIPYLFVIGKKNLTITSRNQTVTFGTSVSTIIANAVNDYQGFEGNDNINSIQGSINYTTNYTVASTVGQTGLVLTPNISQLSSNNYILTAYTGNVYVIDISPIINYPSTRYVFTKNTSIDPIIPTVVGSNLQFSISGLPAGLNFNNTNGVITGIPTVVSNSTLCTISISNSNGSSTATISIVILPDQPQGGIELKERRLLNTDSLELKFNFTQGVAPYTAIIQNVITSKIDTFTNLINNQYVKIAPINSSSIFKLLKLSDANNTYRNASFDRDTTSVEIFIPKIALLLSSSIPIVKPDSNYILRLTLKLKNIGQVNLTNLQVDADLSKLFSSGIKYIIDSGVVKQGNVKINPSYTGLGMSKVINSVLSKPTSKSEYTKAMATLLGNYLFDHQSSLNVGEEIQVALNFTIPKTNITEPIPIQFSCSALASLPLSGNAVSTQIFGILSQDAKPDNFLILSTPTKTLVSLAPVNKLAASLHVSKATSIANGYEFHFKGKLANIGTSNLDSILIVHNFKNAFKNADTAYLKNPITITRGNLAYNNLFDGYINDKLIDHNGSIAYKDSIIIDYDVVVLTNKSKATWLNNLLVRGLSTIDRSIIEDSSVDGLDFDPNKDGLSSENSFTRATVNFSNPLQPIVANAIYTYQETVPQNIRSLVKSYPIGTVPAWCDQLTAKCDTSAPATPINVGKYIYEVKSFDTVSLLYSDLSSYDTITVKPILPVVNNYKYIQGVSSNPLSIQGLVIGMTNSSIQYYQNSTKFLTAPLVKNLIIGNNTFQVSQIVNNIESDKVNLSIELLDLNNVIHLQKIASNPKLLSNSTFDITYTFILSNLLASKIDQIILKDLLQNQMPSNIEYAVRSLKATGGLKENKFYNGLSDDALTLASSSLDANKNDSISFILNIKPLGFNGSVSNQATVSANTNYGVVVMNSSFKSKLEETSKSPTLVELPNIGVVIPDGFSPNNDGIDDKWIIVRPVGTKISVKVFNRWGSEIYAESDYNNTWDGRGVGKFMGEIVPAGTYFYIVESINNSGVANKFTGSLTIVK